MNSLRATALYGLIPAIVSLACSEVPLDPLGQGRFATIYGSADIHEPFEFVDSAWAAEAAEFTVAVFDASALDESDPNEIRQRANWTVTTRLEAQTGTPLCAGELFETQPALSACSGVLIADDLVLTAGHCTNGCSDIRFVFNYALTPSGSLPTLTADDVYRCDSTVAAQHTTDGLDYAVLHLTRPVANREPTPIRTSTARLDPGTPIIMSGHPWRMPRKIADNASVRSNAPSGTHFVTNLDAIIGNSGSGVFDASSKELLGILVRGGADFTPPENNCVRWNRCPDDGCRGEDVMYVQPALQATCAQIEAPFCDP